MHLIYVCEKCGKKQEPLSKGRNFDTFLAICPNCGGTVTIKKEYKVFKERKI